MLSCLWIEARSFRTRDDARGRDDCRDRVGVIYNAKRHVASHVIHPSGPSSNVGHTMLSTLFHRLIYFAVLFFLFWSVQISGFFYFVDFLNFTTPRADLVKWHG